MPGGWASGEGGHVIGGRYRLVGVIGSGGMGTVWRAHDELLDRPVAAKVLNISFGHGVEDQNRRERSLREARATARINHPNVVRVYDYVEDDDRLWIVMELLDARSLDTVLAEDGPAHRATPPRSACRSPRALRTVHRHGVLHRDVKPGNVLIEAGGACRAHRLRHRRAGRHQRADRHRRHRRIAGVHGARAHRERRRRTGLRPVVARRDVVRGGDREFAVPPVDPGRDARRHRHREAEVPPETGPMEPLIRAVRPRPGDASGGRRGDGRPRSRAVRGRPPTCGRSDRGSRAHRPEARPEARPGSPTGSPVGPHPAA
ncbi:serine/threonine-protein kinase [Yinghuangia aomiensis]